MQHPEYWGNSIPFITIPDMRNKVWVDYTDRYLSIEGSDSQKKKLLTSGCVLVSCIATVGLVGITTQLSQFNQQINAVKPRSRGNEYYLYFALKGIEDDLLAIGATGSATLNVNKESFSNIEIPWLDTTKMDEYTSKVKPIFELIRIKQEEAHLLANMRDTLLPKLMSGEIDVSKIDITQLNNHLFEC